jgi:LuxR family quorum sensing-dependent transcriptional regulator
MARGKDTQAGSPKKGEAKLDYFMDKDALDILEMPDAQVDAEHARMLSQLSGAVAPSACTADASGLVSPAVLFERLDFLLDPDAAAVLAMEEKSVEIEHATASAGGVRSQAKHGRLGSAWWKPAARITKLMSRAPVRTPASFIEIVGFTELCLSATTTAQVTRAFDDLLSRQGIGSWFAGTMNYIESGEGLGFGQMPPSWRDRYVEAKHAAYDPVFFHAIHASRPLTWSDCRQRAVDAGAKAHTRQVLDEASEFGLCDGWILPMLAIGAERGAVVLGCERADWSEEAQASLQLVSTYAYEGLRRLAHPLRRTTPRLTRRELEVLRWTAEGKTAWEIGEILTIGVRTIRTHQQSVKAKYGVTSIVQAAVRAVLDGVMPGSSDSASLRANADPSPGVERPSDGSTGRHRPSIDNRAPTTKVALAIDPTWHPDLFRDAPTPRWRLPHKCAS